MIIEPQNLTIAARIALVGAEPLPGSPLTRETTLRVLMELARYGLIDHGARLTPDGARVRAMHIDQTLAAMEVAGEQG